MLSKPTRLLFLSIISKAHLLVEKYIDPADLTSQVNFAAIFAQSELAYEMHKTELEKNGVIFESQPMGNYYTLNTPIVYTNKNISICRVRKPDKTRKELGYCDFEVKNFDKFKEKYAAFPFFTLTTNPYGVAMVELYDPSQNVRVYFPNKWVK